MDEMNHAPIYTHHRSSKREALFLAVRMILVGAVMCVGAWFVVPKEDVGFRIGATVFFGAFALVIFSYCIYLLCRGGRFSIKLTSTELIVDTPVNDGMQAIKLPLKSITSVECRQDDYSDSDPKYVIRYGSAGEYALHSNFGVNPRKLAKRIALQVNKEIVDV